jgi:NADH dehydrogenase
VTTAITKAGKKRVVIVGGGFAAVNVARRLEKAIRAGAPLEVVLLAKENSFVFQPLLPEVISGSIGLTDVVTPLRSLLPGTQVHVREVESIDLAARTVTTAPGFESHGHVLRYDHLVLALGTVTDFRGLRGLPEHAFPFKNLGDALALRNHVIRALDEAAIEGHDAELRRRLLTFVVAGGGFSGVEVVAELNDFVRSVVKTSYPSLDPRELRVVLLHGQDRILPEMHEDLARFATKILEARGVEVRLRARLVAATADAALLASGESVPTKTLVSTIPSSPHPLVGTLPIPLTKSGRIVTSADLRADGHANVWALGDCAEVKIDGSGVAPPTAQHAVRQGVLVAENILACEAGHPTQPFRFKGLGKMGSLGRRSAVAEVLGVKLSGFFAWWLWRTVYLSKMPSWRRRLKVAVSWTLDLFLPPELVQLRLNAAAGISRLHYEPGEVIFHEGDAGDRLYIILQGRAEVLRGEGAQRIAELRAGEYFGEVALLSSARRNATVRCVDAMDVLSLPKREFGLLAAYVPGLRESFERTLEKRAARPLLPKPHVHDTTA